MKLNITALLVFIHIYLNTGFHINLIQFEIYSQRENDLQWERKLLLPAMQKTKTFSISIDSSF